MLKWIKALVRWLRSLAGSTDDPGLRILARYDFDKCGLFRLQDDAIPGAIDYWRINRYDCPRQFFILLLSKQLLASEGQAFDSARLQPYQRRWALSLERQIQAQAHIAATHYWVTGWVSQRTKLDARGRAYQAPEISDLHLLAADLQGFSGILVGDAHALRIARKIAFRLAERLDSRDDPLKHNSWEEIVRAIDWQQWLEGYCRSTIGSGHVLQPPRPDRRRVGDKHRLTD